MWGKPDVSSIPFSDKKGGNLDAAQLNAISSKYTAISNWVQNGGPVDAGTSTQRPTLYCYHNWLQKYTLSDPAFDFAGEEYPDIYTGEPVKIRDSPDYTSLIDEEEEINQDELAAYWSPSRRGYFFDEIYEEAPDAGYCSIAGNQALTINGFPPSALMLCPKSFNTTTLEFTAANLRTAQYRPRQFIAPIPIPRAQRKTVRNQKLLALLPTAVTLLHEMFHLVLGNAATLDADGSEVYDITGKNPKLIMLDYATALVNPESFAVAAIAYDYTLASAPDANGNRIEFFTGWTTQG